MEDRFWQKVDKRASHRCWNWTGTSNASGYGMFSINGKKITASRVSAHLALGADLNTELYVCHKCDNPLCVNPSHLFLGTPKENTRDARQKGRLHTWNGERRGGANPNAKLTRELVRQILHCLRLGRTHRFLAECFGVSEPAITAISTGRTWAHIARSIEDE